VVGVKDVHQRQVVYSVSAPPIKGPITMPIWPTAEKINQHQCETRVLNEDDGLNVYLLPNMMPVYTM
jgi:hypothetical protein